MVWFKTDDGFATHPKVLSIPRAIRATAVGTWLLAGTWSAQHLTDGVVPVHIVDELAGTAEGAEALVRARLWTRTKTAYRFKSWGDYQPTKDSVEESREAERVRKAEYRSRRKRDGKGQYVPQVSQWDNPGTPSGTPTGVPPLPTRPDPTRPLPSEGGRASASAPPVENPEERPEPLTRCDRHLGLDRPPACGACKDARLAHETWALVHRVDAARAAHSPRPQRPPAWDPTTHCEHGQKIGGCEACDYESRHVAEVIHAQFGTRA